MKKIAFFVMFFALYSTGSDAAPAAQRRGAAPANTAATGTTTSTRSPVSARSATQPASGQPGAARSATAGRVAVRGAVPNASAPAAQTAVVGARAASTQKVISTGTKINAVTQNTVVSEECRTKFDGCMDSFCMLDNTNGGRCICSDKNAEFNNILAEIEKLDQQSYQMATLGVEKIEMGKNAEQVIANANAAAQSVLNPDTDSKKKTARRTLDLSAWDTVLDEEERNIFAVSEDTIDKKEGDELYRAAVKICKEMVPECAKDMSMLQMMYSQKVRSDCSAYENSLKQQKTASAQKLRTAEQALRSAALEQLQSANKYDLGQCTTEFKKCMINTGGCGADFSNCASVVAMDNTNTNKSSKNAAKMYSIKGSVTTIDIFASTYDVLDGKKPLCMNVTESCVAVRDQVWDAFLRDIAPQIKSAELIAEDKARQDCIGNISSCFQKACKDTMDPNDPDGSYDMCLSRPETMLNVCKMPLNACGIDASNKKTASESQIWQYVVSRLASMRVDSCTKEVKACLTSDDRCGSDYTQCVGLDTDTIIRMCPYEKLTGCVERYGSAKITSNEVYDELSDMVQGIMLNIDNNMLAECQKAADEAMIKVCGDTENCNALTVDANLGTRSLEYKICEYQVKETKKGSGVYEYDINYNACRTDISQIQDSELGRKSVTGAQKSADISGYDIGSVKPFAGVINGTIYWESVRVDENGKLDIDSYWKTIDEDGKISSADRENVNSELAVLQNNINMAIQAIESDSKVQYCMNGREVQGMRTSESKGTRKKIGEKSADAARFPELTKQMRTIIANAALVQTKQRYYAKYDELNTKLYQDYAKIGERIAEIAGKNSLDNRREIARTSCLGLSGASAIPKSSEPPKNAFGKVMAMLAVTAAVIAIPFTAGASTAAVAIGTSVGVAGGMLGVAGIGLAGNAGSGSANGVDNDVMNLELTQSKQVNNWNYKETVTTTFEWETLNCHKCVSTQNCVNTKNPIFGNKYCRGWADIVETCNDTQF